MAELTYKGSGVFYDPVTNKTWRTGDKLEVSAKDSERLQTQGLFGTGKEKEEATEELSSPLDVSEAKAEGTLIEEGPGPDKAAKGGK